MEVHQEQLLNYSFTGGVKLAILTNGIVWWFYLPLHEGSWEQRKFYTIEIYQQNKELITKYFREFLAKEKVKTGEAISNAEKLKICDIMVASHKSDFAKVLELKGRKRPHFIKNPNELRSALLLVRDLSH